MACLVAQYADSPGYPYNPATLLTLTIRPEIKDVAFNLAKSDQKCADSTKKIFSSKKYDNSCSNRSQTINFLALLINGA